MVPFRVGIEHIPFAFKVDFLPHCIRYRQNIVPCRIVRTTNGVVSRQRNCNSTKCNRIHYSQSARCIRYGSAKYDGKKMWKKCIYTRYTAIRNVKQYSIFVDCAIKICTLNRPLFSEMFYEGSCLLLYI